MSVLSFFSDAFSKVFGPLVDLVRTKQGREKVIKSLKFANALAKEALPWIALVAKQVKTPGEVDDRIVEVLEKGNEYLSDIINEPNKNAKRGRIQGIARELLRKQILDRVARGEEVKIGGITLTKDLIDTLSTGVLNQAIETAFNLFDTAEGDVALP